MGCEPEGVVSGFAGGGVMSVVMLCDTLVLGLFAIAIHIPIVISFLFS